MVGVTVGRLGLSVDGITVGAEDGEKVGEPATRVGALVGRPLGKPDGTPLGLPLGKLLGLPLGKLLGIPLGGLVG